MITDYTIITGLFNSDGTKLIKEPKAAKARITGLLLDVYHIGGATLSECEGVYTNNNGVAMVEPSIKIEITINSEYDNTTREIILNFAKAVKNEFNQESIFFSYRENANSTLIF